ncbi:nitroreductase family protein [Pararhodonellum marinum]|uniref:nitroreductase family protein n=1 Tax=Pararhodonellum marinum TaxID=2755358 RepID=UPI00188F9CA5|nr:nitroreductase family protein [Pararhodonellum marinum]
MRTHYNQNFFDLLQERRSVRIFDQERFFDHETVRACLEMATLAPNSSNLQLWEFYRIKEGDLKNKMVPLCMRQKAALTARELVVVVTRRDKWKKRSEANHAYIKELYQAADEKKRRQALNYYGKLVPKLYTNFFGWSWIKQVIAWYLGLKKPMVREVSETDIRISVHKSAALAAMTFMYAMKAEGYDTCPMEGFDSKRVKNLLDLPKASEISMIIACGEAKPEGIYGKRFRIPSDEVIFDL